ncbi:MAG: ROK family protein [Pseudomonadota bacterium]
MRDDAGLTESSGCGPSFPDTGQHAKPLRQQVFEHVRAAGHASRVDVARSLGISPGSVTTLTSDLIEAGFLTEVAAPARESGRGRPPVSLAVVPEARHVLGLRLSDELHTISLSDFAGTELATASRPSQPTRYDTDGLLDEIGALIDMVMEETTLDRSNISALGIGLPGAVHHETGIVSWSPLLTGQDHGLQTLVEARFGLSTYLENDANVLTLAELWFGSGRTRQDFAVVTIEQGVGMGLVLNNRLFRGAQGLGLELGHMKVQLDGALCRCGQRGCLEAYLADYALVREASTALDRNPRSAQTTAAMLESLFDQAKAGNGAARAIFQRAGRFLSVGLANVVQLFDPALIILSGARMRYDYLYAEEVLAEMQNMTLNPDATRTRVEIHAWGDQVWARGATALALGAVTDALLGDK